MCSSEVIVRHSMAILALSLPVFAQVPANFDVAYFKGDPKTIMVACADQARARDPKDSRLLAEYGRAYLVSGDRAKAEEAFKRAIASDPKDGETHRLIGLAWLKAGLIQEAKEAFELMQKMDPKARSAFAKAAVNLVDAGLFEAGEMLMIRSTKIDKPYDDEKAHEAWLRSFELGSRPTPQMPGQNPAQGHLPVIGLDVDLLRHMLFDGWDCVRFGQAALRTRQTDMAARWFATAIKMQPKEERIWNAIALAYADGGDLRD
jgi:tetratricopeptide (TPR) repeat protein